MSTEAGPATWERVLKYASMLIVFLTMLVMGVLPKLLPAFAPGEAWIPQPCLPSSAIPLWFMYVTGGLELLAVLLLSAADHPLVQRTVDGGHHGRCVVHLGACRHAFRNGVRQCCHHGGRPVSGLARVEARSQHPAAARLTVRVSGGERVLDYRRLRGPPLELQSVCSRDHVRNQWWEPRHYTMVHRPRIRILLNLPSRP